MPAGRPSDYTPELAAEICELLIKRYPLTEICRLEHMPHERTIYVWLQQHAEFQHNYTRARELQAESWADEIVEIAADGRNDWTDRQMPDGSFRRLPDPEVVNRSKLRVDTLKWLMAKRLPKKYGDKATTVHEGGDKPIETVFRWMPADDAKS